MNARYVITETPSDMAEAFGIKITDNFPARYNVAPSQPVPVIRLGPKGERRYDLVRWGFVPAWDRQGSFLKKAIVNIRSETAAEKPSFKNAWRRRHCLFPMNGAYEWLDEEGGKQPYLIAKDRSMPLFCLAGLWEEWLGAGGEEMTTAAFLTRPAVGKLRQLHHRVPVFVEPERYEDWLHADETDDRAAKDIVGQPPPDLTWWKVGRAVNSWKPDGPELIEEVS
ncbi:SOS response-associated peptidase [Parvularcula dongshanensis]|uniref:Abasic site processing protein n=1 Tax=Parvularcula dongshanensis TaxID=1173995 RepID=A0A840I2F6_9PROT|nr:SOS response-associated peptidase [Parvularcula dongshanensis]MBB4658463.1 putative SOS response-associated peptidase YedK [Parvularcula dongshanensis]